MNGNVGFNPTQLLTAAGKLAQGASPDAQGFTSATNGIKFGFVANNVTGFVRALETIGSTKILASPRILVLNKQRAEIQLGLRLGFQTLSQNFTSTIQQVQFLNTGTLLRLRPFVSDDGMVRMEIHPERSSGSVTNNIPNQQTAELTTNVMVPDGATLVIGGLMEDEDDFQMQGLPGLSRLPVLGYLFGSRQKTRGEARAGRAADAAHLVAGPGDGSCSGSECRAAGRKTVTLARGVRRPPSFEFPVPAPAAAPTPAPGAGFGSHAGPRRPRPRRLSGSSTRGAAGRRAGAAGTPTDQDRQGSSPPQRRPWQFFSRFMSRRSPEQKQDQSAGAGTAPELPTRSPDPNIASQPGRERRRYAQPSVTRIGETRRDGSPTPSRARPRDERPTGLRPEAWPPVRRGTRSRAAKPSRRSPSSTTGPHAMISALWWVNRGRSPGPNG